MLIMSFNFKVILFFIVSLSLVACGDSNPDGLTDERRAAREAEQRALTEFSKLESYWLAHYRVADAIELRFGDDFIERTRRHLLKVESESEIDFLLLHLPRRDEFLSYYHGKYTDVGSPEFDNKLFPAQYPAQ